MMQQPLVSIITVVYNGAETLTATIESVVAQSYPNIEYIVVDGGSNDGTVEIIKKHENQISHWCSEPDEGLYDAMNKGMEMATGDYLWFINSGDQIAGAEVASRVFEKAPYADVYYGETLLIDSEGKEIGLRRLSPPEKLSWKDFRHGMLVSHQSFIVSRRVASRFDTRYRFSADYEWCLLVLKKAGEVRNTRIVLSRFLEGGLTRSNILPGLKERFRIMVQFFGFWSALSAHLIIAPRFFNYWIRHKRF